MDRKPPLACARLACARLAAPGFAAVVIAIAAAGCASDGGGAGADTADVASSDDASASDGDGGDAGGDGAGGDDGAANDAVASDASSDDAGAGDAGTSDAGASDAGTSDAGTNNAGTNDAGTNDAGTSDAGTSDAGTTDAGTTDASTTDAGGAVQCGATATSFPTFAKACAGDGDCFVAIHQINCCGTKVALGLAKAEKAAFEAAEKVCQSQYPGCGCAQLETLAEDGYASFNDADFAAQCVAGVCRSGVPSGKPVCAPTGLQKPLAPKACASTSDCTYVLQTVDCCGSQKAVGIAKYAKDAFEPIEFKCAQEMSVCDCAPKPVVLEDGLSAGDGLIAVQCEQGACTTWAK